MALVFFNKLTQKKMNDVEFRTNESNEKGIVTHTGKAFDIPFNLYDNGVTLTIKKCDALGKECGDHPYIDEIVNAFELLEQ